MQESVWCERGPWGQGNVEEDPSALQKLQCALTFGVQSVCC